MNGFPHFQHGSIFSGMGCRKYRLRFSILSYISDLVPCGGAVCSEYFLLVGLFTFAVDCIV